MNKHSVYKVLEEMFPEVDRRILRSYAFVHSHDAEVAVDKLLKEHFGLGDQPQPLAVGSSSNSKSSISRSENRGKASNLEVRNDSADSILRLSKLLSEAGPSSINESLPIATEVVNSRFVGQSSQSISPTAVEPVVLEPLDKSLYHDANGAEVYGGEESVLIRKRRSYDNIDQEPLEIGGENVDSLAEYEVTDAEVSGSIHDEVTHHLDVSEIEAEDNYIHLNVDTLKFIDPTNKDLNLDYSSKSVSEKDENVNPENKSTVNKVEKCNTELLDVSIEDARDKKKTLTVTMSSVVDLMREVEQKEKVAEQLEEQSTRDCSDIYSKVDEIKQTLQRAKEANDMHAGEVYAERAILATEFKELQLRLLTLSERNKSLEILVEMQKALEIRLADTLQQIALAKEEKVNKEIAAREELSYQQHKMEEVVEESKRLMLEVEENSKLQEIVMDRGQIVDILLGEYAVIDQDVLLLKEKFEKRIPLSRSLSSSETSSILASTNSSIQSTATVTHLQPDFETPKKGTKLEDSYGFLGNSSRSEVAESPKSPINTDAYFLCGKEKLDKSSSEVAESPKYPINTGAYFLYKEEKQKQKRIADRKKLLEDEWELFENGDMLAC